MKRLHPASAAFRAFGGGSAGFGFGLLAATGLFAVLGGELDLLTVLLLGTVVVGATALGAGYGIAQYLRFEYDVRDETVSIAHGVFARTERDIPFGRIQNVDIRRGIVGRLVGVATVNLETAGGGSTEAVLNVVTVAEAERIQDVVAGYEHGEPGPGRERDPGEREAGAAGTETSSTVKSDAEAQSTTRRRAPERETLFELSTEDLALLAAVSFDPSGLALLLFSLPFGQEIIFDLFTRSVVLLGGPTLPSLEAITGLPSLQIVFVLLIAAVQFAVAAWVASSIVTAVKYYDFRLAKVGDDLRYERGLLQRYTGTIPLEKVQTLTVRENVAMRRFGYAALNLETAGYGPDQGGNASNTAIPLDDRDVVVALAERLGELEYPAVERPPTRTRRRYAIRLALVPIALTVALGIVHFVGDVFPRWWLPLLTLPLAPVAGHYKWKHRGFAVSERAFVARTGFWRRHTRFVPYYRIQTVIDSRSLFQRWRRLASVTADTASTSSLVGGDATAYDVDEETAVDLHGTLRERLAEDLGRRRDRRGGAMKGSEPDSATDDPSVTGSGAS